MRNRLRQRFRDHETTYGLWITVETPTITEAAVTLGLDWVCIDMEHGHQDFHEVMNHLRVVRGSETAALVRVPGIELSAIKRALDMGAHGVIVPYARSHAEVETAFSYGRYPPRGIRGVSGDRAVKWGLGARDYLDCADEETLIIPLIETRGAVEAIDAILEVPGLEAIFFGPADMSASYGYLGEWEGPGVAERILEVRAKAEAKGIAAGVMARSVEDSRRRRDQGFRMVGLGADMSLLIRAIRENLDALGHKTPLNLWF
ncbi:MAG TPA: aldolase/citrate lyase family protein [Chthonomonadaceae bacterium]|nr:aldolase/citrate lyase family protein [Chthonomonadaceae bacterium]